MAFEVQLPQYSGPLQALLDLIAQEQLPITEVSLAHVADAYVAYVEAQSVPPEELADFLVIAAKLLYLKSRVLLPELPVEDEEDAGDLVHQLKMYEAFVAASREIEKIFTSSSHTFSRARFFSPTQTSFSPPPSLKVEGLPEIYRRLQKRLEPWVRLRRASLEKIVSVKERIVHLQSLLKERARFSFGELARGATKTDTVVSFLALLEMLREKTIHATQQGSFGDIVIKRSV
jgi:segregation and condensation protein A